MRAKRWAGRGFNYESNPEARCRVCDCSEESACEGGCTWADEEQTVCSRCHFLKPGIPVWYYPDFANRRAFAAIIASEPRHLGEDWVVQLEGLGPEYAELPLGVGWKSCAAAPRLLLRPRGADHETMRRLLHWATEVEAELELDGKVLRETREQLLWAIRHAEKLLVPSREDCQP